MQWASSTTSRPVVAASLGSIWSRKSTELRRSGLTRRTSVSPRSTSSWMVSHSSGLAELMVRARIPARAAASTWLRMSASSGETITVGPAPRRRSRAVATKYTADLPQPVRCTTSARRRSRTSAATACHWSSRSRAVPPGAPTSSARTASASARSSWMSMPPCNPIPGVTCQSALRMAPPCRGVVRGVVRPCGSPVTGCVRTGRARAEQASRAPALGSDISHASPHNRRWPQLLVAASQFDRKN